MPMTIESALFVPLRFLRLAVVVLLAWLSVLALAALIIEPTDRVLVIAPGQATALRAVMITDARIASASSLGVVAEGRTPGFVSRLYSSGAWLVLPTNAGGCRGSAPQRLDAPVNRYAALPSAS